MMISVKSAAKELGLSPSTVYQLVREKKIPHVRAGDRVLLNLEKVIAALEVQTENGPVAVRARKVAT